MKKVTLFVLLCYSASVAMAQMVTKVTDPVDWVNPLMGTDSKHSLSNGNTYPSIALPWGMNVWTPQTGKMGDGWQYQYSADKIRGFKQTHQPSPWMNDYGQFSIMPVTGTLRFKEDDRASWFSHKAETVMPYYYSVYLADYDVTTEITPTERAARFRFTFPKTDSAFVVVDAFDKGSYVKIIPSQNKIIGYSTRNSGGVPDNFKNYFVIEFDHPFSNVATFNGDNLDLTRMEVEDNHAGAVVAFKIFNKGERVNAKVASSFISYEQAELNLREIGNDPFETVKQKGRTIWNNTLSRILVEGGTVDQVRTFYSTLYRMVFFPNKLYEKDVNGNIVHYSPYNGKVLPGYMYGGTGFWDTFRALYPFLNLMFPSVNKEMQEGLINDYKEM